MKQFMDETFLLNSPTAVYLFEEHAAKMPIFDYHCHLSAKEIYENQPFSNIGQLWLQYDHYKWRLMRANGIPENEITGNADYFTKFKAYARTIAYAAGNPLYHWTHLELQRYFGIHQVLCEKTAQEIWEKANAVIAQGNFTPQQLILRSNVVGLCTTEDPADSLEYHKLLAENQRFAVKVLPAYRPDNALHIEKANYREYIAKLGAACNCTIQDYDGLKKALLAKMEEFQNAGCIACDHGFEAMPYVQMSDEQAGHVFAQAMQQKELTQQEAEGFQTNLLLFLAKEYRKRNWVMELHVGCNRQQNTRMVQQLGENAGHDSIGDTPLARPLGKFLDALEKENQLPKTVLFTLNASDNWVLASLTGNYQNHEVPSKIQFGTAWWMQDHKQGMEEQMRVLANLGLIGRFIGMLTDSRSFVSYPRHEYFRRILCNLIGEWIEQGEYCPDREAAGRIIEDICFNNAMLYFGITK